MEIDKIIEKLNQDKNTSNINSNSLENSLLTADEKAFIMTFKPEKTLIIYGSLAPNASNYSVVEHIKGDWQQGIVRGRLFKEGWGSESGYWGFKHCGSEEQAEIPVFVLFSDELVDNWAYLDDFEGDEYKRILAKYKLNNGQIGVGFIYAIH
jgi:gamma-glutamylcyclotransferase (GGCT)/AIG2-like uncharacterized protein YtfP